MEENNLIDKVYYDYCPICCGELSFWGYIKECKNGCYRQYKGYVIVFDEMINDNIKLKKKIDYWRENERYLLKLMGVMDNEQI